MKTNISLELDDNQRDCLADWLDDKTSKRLATRKEIVNFVDALVMGIIDGHAAAGQPIAVSAADTRLGDQPPTHRRQTQPGDALDPNWLERNTEDCQECGGLGCAECDDGLAPTQAPGQRQAAWETHPRLTQFATEIDAGLKAHGFAGTYQERSYRRGWTLESISSNR